MAWYNYLDPRPYKNTPFMWAVGKASKYAGNAAGKKKELGAEEQPGSTLTPTDPSNPLAPYVQKKQGVTSVKDAMAQRSPWTNQTGRQWYDLLDQQRAAASGQTPSLAEAQYRQASGDTQAALRGAAAGTNRPGMARASLQQQANVGQGMAAGLTQAGLQERLAAQQAYMEGLKGAGMVEGRDQSAWIQLAQILSGKQPEPSTWDRVAAMAPLIAMMA